jgi:hypothetical protein
MLASLLTAPSPALSAPPIASTGMVSVVGTMKLAADEI